VNETPLRVLIVEDSEDDVAILIDEIRRGGYLPLHEQVTGEQGMRRALQRRDWDIILCDHNLPQFDANQALEVLNERGLDVPFIIVSGRIGEKLVVALMKAGAVDYVHKDDLSGLIPSIERALRDSKRADERRRAHEGLQFLADVSGTLASSLDVDLIVHETARLVVSHLADLCVTDVAADPDEAPVAGVAHIDSRAESAMRERRARQPIAHDVHPVFAVTGWDRPQVVTRVAPAVRGALALASEPEAAEIPIGSALFIPLVVREQRLGVIAMARLLERRTFDDVDLRVAGELARRATAAVEHAFLYRRAERARAAAEAANRLKDEFLAIATHELRTPMTSIVGYTRLLLSDALPRNRRQSALEIIDRSASRQAKLLDDLLDYARVSSGRLAIETAPVDLGDIVEIAIEATRPEAEAKGVELVGPPGDEPLPVMGDASRLEQVVVNLLDNAVRFTPKGGRVEATLRRLDGAAELVVSDTGEGISPEFLPHVFDRFRQGASGPNRPHGGLGLGLAIAKHLVDAHLGAVEARSDGPGRGATFVVRLPLAGEIPADARRPDAAAGGRHKPSFRPPPELAGLRILVVDDDEGARQLLDGILSPCHAKVVTAASVADAMEAFGHMPPDLLVSDISMPGESGWDLIRRIRRMPGERGGAVPAVALSAYARDEDRVAALGAGFNCFLVKPIDPQEFVVALSKVVRAGAPE
jgi:signal transduction histidine kinase/CheY-like chemotaxis protein